MTLLLTVLLPIVGALASAAAGRRGGGRVAAAAACGALTLSFGAALALGQAFAAGRTSLVAALGPWLPLRGAELTLRLEPPMAPVLLAVTGASALVAFASLARPSRPAAYVAAQLLVAGTVVVITGSNLVLLLVGWEVAAFAGYVLLGERAERAAAADAARASFTVARLGSVLFLVATLGLLGVFHTVDLAELRGRIAVQSLVPSAADALRSSMALLLAAAIARSAQLPLSQWLADAVDAPGPGLALIHAVALAPAGVVLLLRLAPLAPPGVLIAAAIVGGATALVASVVALAQEDRRRALAWAAIAQLGVLFVLVGMGATFLAMLLLLVHVLTMAALLLVTGEAEPGTRLRTAAIAVAAAGCAAFVVTAPLAGRIAARAGAEPSSPVSGVARASRTVVASALVLAAAGVAVLPLAPTVLSLGVPRDPVGATVLTLWVAAAAVGVAGGYGATARRGIARVPAPLARAARGAFGVPALHGVVAAPLGAITRTLEDGTEVVLRTATGAVAFVVGLAGYLAASAHRAPVRVYEAVLVASAVVLVAFWSLR